MVELLSNLIENVRNFGLERVFKRYYSVYRAEVTSNKDKKLRGRVKIKVPQLFGEFELPQMAEPLDFRNSAKGKGEFFPPDEGDWVYVMFEGGDQRFPVYMGGWYGNGDLDPVFTHEADGKPLVRGYKDKFGQYWIFDQTDGKQKITLFQPGDNKVEISAEKDKESITVFNKDQDMVMDRDGIRITDKHKNIFNMNKDGLIEDIIKDHVVNVKENNTTTIGKDQTTEVKGKKTETITGDYSVSSDGKVDIKGKGGANLESDAAATVKGKASASLESDGVATVKGTAGTMIGSPAAATAVLGSAVALGGPGGAPVAKVGSLVVVTGNLGIPAVGQVLQGSSTVTVK